MRPHLTSGMARGEISRTLTNFSGMSAFRLSTISRAAARFSSEARASPVPATVPHSAKGD
jgi:hypothetical protein